MFFVSIHAPARGATWSLTRLGVWDLCFNPRARTGRDLTMALGLFDDNEFQSTRPHGARHHDQPYWPAVKRFQSTRPHGARHAMPPVDALVIIVSIHAPARGATVKTPSG